MTRQDFYDILEDHLHVVNNKETIELDTVNGIEDPDELKEKKKELLSKSTEYIIDQMVKHIKYYPDEDKTVFHLDVDCIVMDAKQFGKILRAVDNGFFEEG